jgi:DNA uptake protein ComE-like DNA-binding protein
MSGIRMIALTALALGLAAAPMALAATAAPTTASKSHATKTKAPEKVDLNTASREDLRRLGIDGATADRIVGSRPFKSKSELHTRHLMTEPEYQKLSGKVTVKAPSPAPAK